MPRTLSREEFDAIKAQVLKDAPTGLSQDDFERAIKPVFDGALAQAENSPDPITGSALGRFAAGAWKNLNPVSMVEGAYNAMRHPLDTLSAIGSAQVGQLRQAADLAGQGRYLEAAGHGVAGVLPLVGPAAAQAGERMAAGDVAGGLGESAGLLAPVAASVAARNAPGLIGKTPLAEPLAQRLEQGAQARVADVLSPKVGANKVRFGNQAQKIAPAIAKDLATDGAPLSREGLAQQIGGKLAESEAALDAAADVRNPLATYSTKPLLDALKAKREALAAHAVEADRPIPAYTGKAVRTAQPGTEIQVAPNTSDITAADIPPQQRGYRTLDETPGRFAKEPTREGVPLGADVTPSPNRARAAVLDQAIKEVESLGPIARYEDLRRIRQAYDGPAKAIYAPAVTPDYLKAQGGALGAADVTGALREHLATLDPKTAAANGQYALYRTANDVLKATEEVERTRPKVGRQIIARATGALMGGQAAGVPGALAGYVGGPLVDSALSAGATTQLKTAALMQKLANAIRSGDQARAFVLSKQIRALVPSAARATGRVTSPSESQTPEAATSTP